MKSLLTDWLHRTIAQSAAQGNLPADAARLLAISATKHETHGDFATPLALLLAQREKSAPRAMAQRIVDLIQADPDFSTWLSRVEIAGPGYINFFLAPACGHRVLLETIRQGERYGRSAAGAGSRVQVEFVSANPTGPLHVASGRAAALGDALCHILSAVGFDVQREYYVNDIGNQVERLGHSVYLRYRQQCGETIAFPEEGYQGDYVTEIAQAIAAAEGRRFLEGDESAAVRFFTAFALQSLLGSIQRDMAAFGVRFDRWFSEGSLADETDRVIADLKTRGHLYEREGAWWLATTRCADDKDRVVVRADGRRTYFASDIAYHHNKFARGFDRVIDIWGADHHGYIARVKAAVSLLGHPPERLTILLHQLVNLMRHGTPVPMSKRAGTFVTLKEVIDEVGVDATRFFFLMRRADTTLDFDLELAKKHSNDNPVYYVQYAHARLCSILRVAVEAGIDPAAVSREATVADLAALTSAEEREVIKQVACYPDHLRAAAEALEPHRIVFYLQELAGRLHRYYFGHRIIGDDRALTHARLVLVQAVQVVLQNALTLLGIRAPERM